MAFGPNNKDVEEYFQLLSTVRQEQSFSLTDSLCAFVDLLSERLKQGKFAAVQQGLDRLKIIFDLSRSTLDSKNLKFEQDHSELMGLAFKTDSQIAAALILKDISPLDPSRR